MIFILAFAYFSWAIVPSLVYYVELIDRHYFGLFDNSLPPLATTTPHKNYYMANNKPFRTIETVMANKTLADEHRRLGLPPPWHDEERLHPYNRAYQWFKSRALQSDKSTSKTNSTAGVNSSNSTNMTLNATIDLEDGTQLNKKKFTASYPDPILTKDQIKYWGFILYLIGKLLFYYLKFY